MHADLKENPHLQKMMVTFKFLQPRHTSFIQWMDSHMKTLQKRNNFIIWGERFTSTVYWASDMHLDLVMWKTGIEMRMWRALEILLVHQGPGPSVLGDHELSVEPYPVSVHNSRGRYCHACKGKMQRRRNRETEQTGHQCHRFMIYVRCRCA